MQTGDEGHMGRVQPSPALAYQMIEPNMPVAVATASVVAGGGGTQHSVPTGGCKPIASPEQCQDDRLGTAVPHVPAPPAPLWVRVFLRSGETARDFLGTAVTPCRGGPRASRVAAPAGTHPPSSAGVLCRQAGRWDAPNAHLDMSPLLRDTSRSAPPPWSLPAPHHGQDRTRTK